MEKEVWTYYTESIILFMTWKGSDPILDNIGGKFDKG
jgi:hypothetical protein